MSDLSSDNRFRSHFSRFRQSCICSPFLSVFRFSWQQERLTLSVWPTTERSSHGALEITDSSDWAPSLMWVSQSDCPYSRAFRWCRSHAAASTAPASATTGAFTCGEMARTDSWVWDSTCRSQHSRRTWRDSTEWTSTASTADRTTQSSSPPEETSTPAETATTDSWDSMWEPTT